MTSENRIISIGATEELSLRVSVATLVRVVFQNPKDGGWILALERKATLVSDAGESRVLIKCQPFGGAVRFRSLIPLQRLVGDFHFDSERSRSELDFRIFIRPVDWDAVKEFCLQHFKNGDELALESGPARELAEEMADALELDLKPEQYSSTPLHTVIEDQPAATDNIYARGYQTARVYRIFEVRVLDPALCKMLLENSERYSNQDLHERAIQDARQGGKGRANAILTVTMKPLMEFYLALSPEARNAPVFFGENFLDGNVCAILEGVSAPKYRSL